MCYRVFRVQDVVCISPIGLRQDGQIGSSLSTGKSSLGCDCGCDVVGLMGRGDHRLPSGGRLWKIWGGREGEKGKGEQGKRKKEVKRLVQRDGKCKARQARHGPMWCGGGTAGFCTWAREGSIVANSEKTSVNLVTFWASNSRLPCYSQHRAPVDSTRLDSSLCNYGHRKAGSSISRYINLP